ncbi:MAG: MarR family transcriptional regulator [Cohaesibacteraceae bacterium]|nr:MarR family transcriptional regulator [Cohaesibacteraceae bacterium]
MGKDQKTDNNAPHPGFELGYVLKQAQHALRKRMDEGLRPLGLTVPQYAALTALELTPGASNAQLARKAFITPQSMQGILVNLEKSGLIIRTQHPDHGRIQQTTLTERGTDITSEAHDIVKGIEQILGKAVHPLDYNEIVSMLERCRDHLEGLTRTGVPVKQPSV